MTAPANFNSPDRVIRQAMINAGKLNPNSDPTPSQYANYMPRLNDLVNFYCTKGLKLWLILDLAVTLVANQALYTFGPTGNVTMTKPIRSISGYYLDVNNNQRPLIPISWDEYKRLSNVTNKGALNSFMVDKQQLTLNVYFWLTPDAQAATGTAHLSIEQQVTQVVGLYDVINFPVEWFIALHWGLADQISTGQPASVKYDPSNPSNSILLADDWSGLH